VRIYKKVKNELYAWSQLFQIISDFIILMSLMALGFGVLALCLDSYPFVMIMSIDNNSKPRFYPDKNDNTLFYGYLLHVFAIILCLQAFGLGVSMRFMKKRKDIDMCNKLRLISSLNGISMIFI